MANANSYHNIEPYAIKTHHTSFKYTGYDSVGHKYHATRHNRNRDKWRWAQTVVTDGSKPYFYSDTLAQASRILETINAS